MSVSEVVPCRENNTDHNEGCPMAFLWPYLGTSGELWTFTPIRENWASIPDHLIDRIFIL